uniref:No apical meristem-associated C-terminal domain-containing protein n=1 Tax=Tanacetum cinerariifolium TaxID=118510 RepID=A0A6L2MCX7_TANCI|nr:hypothetical protein [Tanacetum cinerariifolium]
MHLTPDPNFQLSGVSSPIRFRPVGFVYNSPQQPIQPNYQNRPFSPPYNSQQAFYQQPMYRPTYEPSSLSLKPNQGYSLLNRLNLDMDMENLFNTQEIRVKVRAVTKNFIRVKIILWVWVRLTVRLPLKTTLRSKRWWRPSKLKRGFWLKFIEYFEKEMRSNREYDSILNKWKNRVRSRIGAFCAISDNVQRRNESGSCDLTVYQKACVEYAVEYDHDFSLEPCWKILKDHSAWKQVEMPSFYLKRNPGSKKAETSETTSGTRTRMVLGNRYGKCDQ